MLALESHIQVGPVPLAVLVGSSFTVEGRLATRYDTRGVRQSWARDQTFSASASWTAERSAE